jgi:hypothetical protein
MISVRPARDGPDRQVLGSCNSGWSPVPQWRIKIDPTVTILVTPPHSFSELRPALHERNVSGPPRSIAPARDVAAILWRCRGDPVATRWCVIGRFPTQSRRRLVVAGHVRSSRSAQLDQASSGLKMTPDKDHGKSPATTDQAAPTISHPVASKPGARKCW